MYILKESISNLKITAQYIWSQCMVGMGRGALKGAITNHNEHEENDFNLCILASVNCVLFRQIQITQIKIQNFIKDSLNKVFHSVVQEFLRFLVLNEL